MEFKFGVVIVVKNDEVTKEAGIEEVAQIMSDRIAESMEGLPWVLSTDVITIRGG